MTQTFVATQNLIKFCQAEVEEINRNQPKLYDAMQNKNLSDSDYEALHTAYSANVGAHAAYRKVVDWACEHVASGVRAVSESGWATSDE